MAINYVMDNFELPKEYKDKFNDMLVALEKKSSSKKMTKVQEANENLKADILAEMEIGKSYTIADMLKTFKCCADLSTSKVSAMVTQLKDKDLVVRKTEKGRAYFTKA